MATYCNETVQYRGRLVEVSFRYECYNGMYVAKGKPLEFTSRDRRKVLQILRRRGRVDERGHHPFDCFADID